MERNDFTVLASALGISQQGTAGLFDPTFNASAAILSTSI